ncbi:DUF6356 family protein [Salinarimonas rosea]|uniref:DUF6356 family protein n=1 Tax=Salinarimonas rosea TaxID=552063 RepID=UPI00048D1132|nr:DUF6356 family protein [Salinarimonas rosea]
MTDETPRRLSFTDHPASVGETYLEHMGVAFSFGGRLLVAGLACLAHGVFPFLFTKTGSRTVGELHERMVANRVRHGARAAGRETAEAAPHR